MISKIYYIVHITKKKNIDAYAFRWGAIPIDILFTGFFYKSDIYLRHLTFLKSTQMEDWRFKVIAFFRKIVLKSDYICGCDTPSFVTKKLVANEYGIENTLISKNGTENSNANLINKNREFIYMGAISKKRKTDILLKAFENTDKELDIYGFGEMESEVKKYARKNNNINFYGKIEYELLKKELPKYKFGIDLTFVNTEYGKASYSQKIAQYLSFGLNVIGIECMDNKFIETKNIGILVEPEVDSFENAINNIIYKPFKVESVKEYIYYECILKQTINFWQSGLVSETNSKEKAKTI